jgi:rhodanese-related sulfurtransferase
MPLGQLEVDIESFAAAHREDAYVLDVREPEEFVAGHVPRAVALPMSVLAGRASEIPTDRTVYVICASGNRSMRVASALVEAGYDAVSVRGGTSAWTASGRPVARGAAAA